MRRCPGTPFPGATGGCQRAIQRTAHYRLDKNPFVGAGHKRRTNYETGKFPYLFERTQKAVGPNA